MRNEAAAGSTRPSRGLARVDAATDYDPLVRLYRGEGPRKAPRRRGVDAKAQWYTAYFPQAAKYARRSNGQVYYLEMPRSEALKLLKGGDTALVPDSLDAERSVVTDPDEARFNRWHDTAPRSDRRAAVGGIRPTDIPLDLQGTWKTLRKELDAMGLKDVRLELTNAYDLTPEPGRGIVKGMYIPEEKLILLAYGWDDIGTTMDHEVIHALKDMNVITDGECWMLVEHAAKIPQVKNWVDTYYSGQPRAIQREESVAEMFARWREYTAPPTKFARVWQRVKSFFAALKRVFVAEDYKTAEDVLAAISTGEIGRRSRPMSRADIWQYVNEERGGQPRARMGPAEKLPEPLQEPAKVVATNVSELGKKGLLFSAFTRDVADMAAKVLPSAKKMVDLQLGNHAISRMYEQRLGDIKRMYEKLPASMKGDGASAP